MKRPRESNNLLTVKIERLVPDGFGLAFAENLTIFVPLVAVGDLSLVRIERRKGKIAFAELVEILEPSPDRVDPPCPYFGICGGCDFQQMNYEAQLRAKTAILKDCLRRIGKIDWQNEIEITPSPKIWDYRTRAQWKHQSGKLGYFERNSHLVVDVAECPILAPALQKTLTDIRRSRKFEFFEVQAVAAADDISLRYERVETAAQGSSDFDENFYAANKQEADRSRDSVRDENETAREINTQVGKFVYRFDANCFFQVNHALLSQFIETAIADLRGETALDLYCGVGLFALFLAERFETVVGVEGNRQSIAFARKNAEAANIKNASFETASVADWLVKNAEDLSNPDFVLLDPPRGGAERETVDVLCRLRPARISYVSCNPATLARDLRILIETGGYEIEKIQAFDFFPQTHHVETIVRLKL